MLSSHYGFLYFTTMLLGHAAEMKTENIVMLENAFSLCLHRQIFACGLTVELPAETGMNSINTNVCLCSTNILQCKCTLLHIFLQWQWWKCTVLYIPALCLLMNKCCICWVYSVYLPLFLQNERTQCILLLFQIRMSTAYKYLYFDKSRKS